MALSSLAADLTLGVGPTGLDTTAVLWAQERFGSLDEVTLRRLKSGEFESLPFNQFMQISADFNDLHVHN